MIYRLRLAYRGTRYAGWQRQENALSVQEVFERALEQILGCETRITASSRTDAGVHARGQVAHLATDRQIPSRALVFGANRHLPEDARVLSAVMVPDGFHARRCALGKQYRYRLSRARVISPLDSPFVAPMDQRVDLQRVRAAGGLLVGRHDFSAFAKSGGSPGSPVRLLEAVDLVERAEHVDLWFRGESFLRGMVRAMVGTLLEVGRGRFDIDHVAHLLSGASRAEAGANAPARGLVLERVYYSNRWQGLEQE